MKILFAGTPAIAVPTLKALSDTHQVSGVLTNPDRPAGRKNILTPSPVKVCALELAIPVFQPEKLDEKFIAFLKAEGFDTLITFAFGKIFKKDFLDIFTNGAFNIHPSLLPRWRGPAPINAAILAGDTVSGITIQKMALRMDTGDIALQLPFPLDGNESAPDLTEWKKLVSDIETMDKEVTIGLVGKYIQLHDAYLSVAEALRHAGYGFGADVKIEWIDSEELNESNYEESLSSLNGIIVPGGFGDRGIEGMILAAKYARTHNLPYFGICLGMQIAVIEYARNVAGLKDACSGEFHDATDVKVIDFMPGQSDSVDKGGTLRLGSYPCVVTKGSLLERCYYGDAASDEERIISERHRHRYEFNNDYKDVLTGAGLVISGQSPNGELVETVEIPENTFYLGVQFHPEFKSRPNRPHPIFRKFIESALDIRG